MVRLIGLFLFNCIVFGGIIKINAQAPNVLVEDFHTPQNLGPAVLASQTQGALIGETSLYFVTNGLPAIFYETDKLSGEIIYSQPIQGSDVIWAMAQGSNDNVYFSGTNDGYFYEYDPLKKRLHTVGKNPSAAWVWALESGPKGNLYGVTYPNAGLFNFNPSSGDFEFMGKMHPTEKYARSVGVGNEKVYIGIGTKAALIEMDLVTNSTKEIPLPISGTNTTISGIWNFGDRLFVGYGTSLIVLDSHTYEVKNHIKGDAHLQFGGRLMHPHTSRPFEAIFIDRHSGQLWVYNMKLDLYEPLEGVQIPTSPAKALRWSASGEMEVFHYEIMYSSINLATRTVTTKLPQIPLNPLPIQSLTIKDDFMYLGGYQGGFSQFQISTNKYNFQERNPHQIEGIGSLGEDIILGTYGGARMYKFSPKNQYNYNSVKENPILWYDIEERQSRPFTITSNSRFLVVGTIPDYGELGGAITIYDNKEDQWETIRNIIPEQSIIGLALYENHVFGGSSIAGGLGISPNDSIAKIFVKDLDSGDTEVIEPSFKSLDRAEMIGELSLGPDNHIWGVAYGEHKGGVSSVIFVLDPESRKIHREVPVFKGVKRGSQWRPFYMRWSKDGYLYTTAARKLSRVNPKSMEVELVLDQDVNLMDVDAAGNVFFAHGVDLYKIAGKSKQGSAEVQN